MQLTYPIFRKSFFPLVELTIVILLFSLQAIYFWALPPNFLDEGIWLELTRFIARGQRPYVDFPSVYGPYYLRALSFGVTALGGKLIHLRLFMGCFQGLICFLILRWSLRGLMGHKSAFFICFLAAISIAHPRLDATMFWGLRYFSALLWIVPLCLEMADLRPLTRLHRTFLYFLWGTLFFYSGEAGVISAPVLVLYLFYRWNKDRTQIQSIAKDIAIGFTGIFVPFLILGREAWLYAHELLIDAPVTYRQMGFNYPFLNWSTIHFYFPFLLLILSVVVNFRRIGLTRWSIWAATAALLPALKVATSRSDDVHLGYAYPFVIFLTFLLCATSKTFIADRLQQQIFIGFNTSSLLICLMSFLSAYDLVKFQEVYAGVKNGQHRSYNSAFGIWMPNTDYNRLKQSTNKVQEILAQGSQKLFVFPFQQILYSEFGINPLHIEPIQPCSLKSTRAECSRNFNGTNPDLVVWVPEDSMYSWAFDAYYASFEYPEAIETLSREFSPPILLGDTNWYLYQRKKPFRSGTNPVYFNPMPEDLEKCSDSVKTCPFLEAVASSLRLPTQSSMVCQQPVAAAREKFTTGFGVQFSIEAVQKLGIEPAWVCKNSGTDQCKCSRIRKRSDKEDFFTKWAWANFISTNHENTSRITVYGIPKKGTL